MPLLLDSFDWSGYSSECKKICTLRVLLMFLGRGRSFESCPTGGEANEKLGGGFCLGELRIGGNYANGHVIAILSGEKINKKGFK